MNEDVLKLENQLCFPLYACSKEIVKRYKPFLDHIQLTYTQYITMMVLWEHEVMSVKQLGERLYLDSGTITPVVKRLEALGYVKRQRSIEDERSVNVHLTDSGRQLKDEAASIPVRMSENLNLTDEEAAMLYRILYKILKDE